jgi:hypothetical protein
LGREVLVCELCDGRDDRSGLLAVDRQDPRAHKALTYWVAGYAVGDSFRKNGQTASGVDTLTSAAGQCPWLRRGGHLLIATSRGSALGLCDLSSGRAVAESGGGDSGGDVVIVEGHGMMPASRWPIPALTTAPRGACRTQRVVVADGERTRTVLGSDHRVVEAVEQFWSTCGWWVVRRTR